MKTFYFEGINSKVFLPVSKELVNGDDLYTLPFTEDENYFQYINDWPRLKIIVDETKCEYFILNPYRTFRCNSTFDDGSESSFARDFLATRILDQEGNLINPMIKILDWTDNYVFKVDYDNVTYLNSFFSEERFYFQNENIDDSITYDIRYFLDENSTLDGHSTPCIFNKTFYYVTPRIIKNQERYCDHLKIALQNIKGDDEMRSFQSDTEWGVITAKIDIEEKSYSITCEGFYRIYEAPPQHTHTYEVTSQTAATCSLPGVTRLVCSDCGDEAEEIIPALGHNYNQSGVCLTCGRRKLSRIMQLKDYEKIKVYPKVLAEYVLDDDGTPLSEIISRYTAGEGIEISENGKISVSYGIADRIKY